MSGDNKRGRPKADVNFNEVSKLLQMKLSVPKIALLTGVSVSTIRRSMEANNTKVRDAYSTLPDESIKEILASVMVQQPNTGIKLMKGMLFSKHGIRIPEQRLRRLMRETDPEGVENRRRNNRAIIRRNYFVPYSNSLWHIDGNHKCVRYRIVIRGAIDGKSRNCMYLEAGDNNLATSSLESFFKGVQRYGTVPYRTRSDKGGENVLIARFMLMTRGTGRGSHLTGRSVNNQRIERFWRDVNKFTYKFYQTFLELEEDGLLNIDDENSLFILHHVYLPRINQELEEYRKGWNSHPLSTESNLTPEQLLLIHARRPTEIFDQENLRSIFLTSMQYHDPSYDNDDPIRNPSVIRHSINSEKLEALSTVNVLRYSENNAKDIYHECCNALM